MQRIKSNQIGFAGRMVSRYTIFELLEWVYLQSCTDSHIERINFQRYPFPKIMYFVTKLWNGWWPEMVLSNYAASFTRIWEEVLERGQNEKESGKSCCRNFKHKLVWTPISTWESLGLRRSFKTPCNTRLPLKKRFPNKLDSKHYTVC